MDVHLHTMSIQTEVFDEILNPTTPVDQLAA